MSTVLPARLTRWLRTRRAEVAAAALVVAVAGPLVHDYTAQPASRYTFTAAIVDHGTVRLDRYTHVLGVDRAVVDGHTVQALTTDNLSETMGINTPQHLAEAEQHLKMKNPLKKG